MTYRDDPTSGEREGRPPGPPPPPLIIAPPPVLGHASSTASEAEAEARRRPEPPEPPEPHRRQRHGEGERVHDPRAASEAAQERATSERAERASPELTTHERHQAKEAATLDAKTTHAVILEQGEKELARTPSQLAWSGLAAGLSMGLSMAAEAMLRSRLPDAEWRPLVAKLGYSVGFLAVILGSQQLFTENTLTPVVPYLSKKSDVTLAKVLRLWTIVLLANVAGTFLFALASALTTAFPDEMRAAFASLGTEVVAHSFWTTFARAVGAGWIIALMMWMLPDAKDARLWVIVVMTYIIGAAGLSHIVAGSAEAFYVVLTGTVGWGAFFNNFFLPTLIGNVLGGTLLVAALNHGQVEG